MLFHTSSARARRVLPARVLPCLASIHPQQRPRDQRDQREAIASTVRYAITVSAGDTPCFASR